MQILYPVINALNENNFLKTNECITNRKRAKEQFDLIIFNPPAAFFNQESPFKNRRLLNFFPRLSLQIRKLINSNKELLDGKFKNYYGTLR